MKHIQLFESFINESNPKSTDPYAKYKSEEAYYQVGPRKNGVQHLLATFPDLVIKQYSDQSDRMYWWTRLCSDAVDLGSEWAQSKIKEFMGFKSNMNKPELPPLPDIEINYIEDKGGESSTITRQDKNTNSKPKQPNPWDKSPNEIIDDLASRRGES